MKIGFTSKGDHWDAEIDPRFGRAAYLLVYDDGSEIIKSYNNEIMKEREHGAGPGTASKLIDMKTDVLITGNGPGDNAKTILTKGKIEIYIGADGMSIQEAYNNYKNDKLTIMN